MRQPVRQSSNKQIRIAAPPAPDPRSIAGLQRSLACQRVRCVQRRPQRAEPAVQAALPNCWRFGRIRGIINSIHAPSIDQQNRYLLMPGETPHARLPAMRDSS
jgi:hypothetical protein